MGLMDINRGVKKYALWILTPLGVLMLGGAVFNGFGTTLGMGGDAGERSGPSQVNSEDKPVAIVGDISFTRAMLDQQIEKATGGNPMALSPVMMDQFRYMVLTQMSKKTAAMVAAAKAAGVTVTDADLAAGRDKLWAAQRPQIIQQLGLTDKATDAQIDQAIQKVRPGLTTTMIKANIPDDQVRQGLYQEGLINALKKKTHVDEATVKKSYDEIQVRHILIKSGDGGLPDAQAKTKAEKVLAEVKADPSKMAALAAQYSDDPGSKAKGGFYDWAPASQYVPEFTAGALAAGVGKVYPDLVKTQFGYHIIKLEGERPGKDFPKDWDKAKQKYIDEYAMRNAQQEMGAALAAQESSIKVEILDPGIRAAQLQEEAATARDDKERTAKLEQAIAELNKVKKEDDRGGAVPLRKAEIFKQLKRDKDAIAAYDDSLKFRNTVDTRIELANLYLKEKDNTSAIKQLDEAEKLPVPEPKTMANIGALYLQAGDTAKSKLAMGKAAELQKREQQIKENEAKAAAEAQKAAAAAAKSAAAPPSVPGLPDTSAVAGTPAAPPAASPATAASAAPATKP